MPDGEKRLSLPFYWFIFTGIKTAVMRLRHHGLFQSLTPIIKLSFFKVDIVAIDTYG